MTTKRKVKATKQTVGRRGGRATLKNHGPEFFSRIGAKGGRTRARNMRRKARETRP